MKKKKPIIVLATLTIILLLVFQIGCKKDIVEDENTPIVTTAAIHNVTHNSASGGGNVTDQGSSTVYARGVCWDTIENPTTADSLTISGEGPGSYTSKLTNLLPSTKYYLRAYATNKQGTSYGDNEFFKTLSTALEGVKTLEWKKEYGLPGTGLGVFGLKWTSNGKEIMAQIEKDENGAEKFVELPPEEWVLIETIADLSEAIEIADDMDLYDGISAEVSNVYDEVLATKHNEEYFIIHITQAIIEIDTTGPIMTITGHYNK